tara:strand:+ start:184 stop:930 length:747 start_codon:yes stop_codon:yes gene_type:complete
MSKRKTISKKVRFEVFKRDSFTCQYCGAKSPDVILHVDHINPVSKGGDNEIINLVTSCEACNSGKSDRLLNDSTSIEVQRAQLEELNKRREQLEMMLAWRDSLKGLDDETVDAVVERIEGPMAGFIVNEHGKQSVRKWLKRFSVSEILDAADLAGERLDGEPDQDAINAYFNSIPKICATRRMPESAQRLRYARGILRNRIYVNEKLALPLMEAAVAAGMDPEDIVEYAKVTPNWTAFRAEMEAQANG